MTHQLALLASLMLMAAAPCGAQAPASDAPAAGAASSAKPDASAASSATPPATPSAAAPAAAAPTTPATAAKPAGSETTASSEPSPEVLKEARREGFKPKKRDGVTLYCFSDRSIGTKFETEKCFDEQHMEMLVQQRQDQRNQLGQPVACGGASCNGH
jgi:hypothetical protein